MELRIRHLHNHHGHAWREVVSHNRIEYQSRRNYIFTVVIVGESVKHILQLPGYICKRECV